MSWITEIDEADADGELRDVYAELMQQRGKVANIMRAHGANPGALRAHLNLYMHLLFGASKLSRAEREAIGVVVSANNNCTYCVSHHAEALSRYETDNEKLRRIMAGEDFGHLTDRSEKLLTYAAKLTRNPSAMTREDIDTLRKAGLGDDEILDVNLVTSYFNFVNRIALGLGVKFS
ncbi:MAG: peroxidase-related enzyme, partial [Pseudomonadota bacterium]